MAGSEDVRRQLVHLRLDVSFEADVQVWVLLVKEHLELIEAQLVAGLELAVVLGKLLHGIVCQVHELVA